MQPSTTGGPLLGSIPLSEIASLATFQRSLLLQFALGECANYRTDTVGTQ